MAAILKTIIFHEDITAYLTFTTLITILTTLATGKLQVTPLSQ